MYRWSGSSYIKLNDIDLSSYQLRSEKNQPNGYLGANSNGNLSPSQLDQDSNNRLVTDTLMAYWNAKANPLDYTPENIANKGQASGYAPLDSNGHLSGDFVLSARNIIRWVMFISTVIDSYQYFGQSASTQSIYSNQSPFKAGNSSALFSKTYTLPSASSNYNASHSNISITINGNVKINSEILVSFKNSNATTSHTFAIIFGNCYYDNTETLYGDGFVIAYNPTINGGNFRFIKVVNSVSTIINSNIQIIKDAAVLYSCKYNTQLLTAELYINKTLVYTFTSAALSANTAYKVGANLASSSNTETLTRRYSIFYGYFEGEVL